MWRLKMSRRFNNDHLVASCSGEEDLEGFSSYPALNEASFAGARRRQLLRSLMTQTIVGLSQVTALAIRIF